MLAQPLHIFRLTAHQILDQDPGRILALILQVLGELVQLKGSLKVFGSFIG